MIKQGVLWIWNLLQLYTIGLSLDTDCVPTYHVCFPMLLTVPHFPCNPKDIAYHAAALLYNWIAHSCSGNWSVIAHANPRYICVCFQEENHYPESDPSNIHMGPALFDTLNMPWIHLGICMYIVMLAWAMLLDFMWLGKVPTA